MKKQGFTPAPQRAQRHPIKERRLGKSPHQNLWCGDKASARLVRGFTVIELLVVIAIIGLLSSVVLVALDLPGKKAQARLAKTLEFSQTMQSAIGDELVGSWTFENVDNGKTPDMSGYNNEGTIYGATQVDGLKLASGAGTGKALSFDGQDDYIMFGQILPADKINPFTFSAWAQQNASSYWYTIIGTNSSYAQIGFSYGQIAVGQNGGGAGWWLTGPIATVGQWYHIVGVYDGANASLYVNGELKAGPVAKSFTYNHGISMIGRYSSVGGEWMNGLIDEVRIYSKALTLAEIQKQYAAGVERHQNLAAVNIF
ncbi:MAG: LamG-like jellyroll fold domain-containing protein [Patescibacteria group bacterium]